MSFRRGFPDYHFPKVTSEITKDSDISNDLMKAVKKGDVPFRTEIEYILQYSVNHGISMDIINEVGHNYKYGAEKYEN